MKLLITGGCGFAGSNLALLFKTNYPTAKVLVMDNLKRRGAELNLQRLLSAGIEFVHGDIRNREDFDQLGTVDVLIEAAAEPSVLAGIDSTPDYVLNTNLLGTINCLNYAVKQKAVFIFLSTSRVYPFATLDAASFHERTTRFQFSEEQTLNGVSPAGISKEFPLEGARSLYGATKLASELLLKEYEEFFGLRAVVNRCGVLTGPWQMGKVDQGVVVLWMARHFWPGKLTYNGYGGEGKQVRDILHIHDLYRLIDWQIHNFEKVEGKTYNVGGGIESSISLQELTRLCEKLTGNRIDIKPVLENRMADVRMYITDNTHVTADTGWKPLYMPEQILEEIFSWIRENQEQLKPILS